MRIAEVTRGLAVAAMLLAGAASATSNRTLAECPPGRVCGYQPMPRFERNQSVSAETPIDGVDITAEPTGATGFRLRIANSTEQTIKLVWDESSFVDSAGKSAGRLIRGETRKLDIEKAQPPSPVAPTSSLDQVVFAERLYVDEERERDLADKDARFVDMKAIRAYRQQRDRMLRGGRIYLTLEVRGDKETWVGVVK